MEIDEKPQAPGAQQLQTIGEKLGRRILSVAYLTSGAANHVFRAQTSSGTLILKLSKVDQPELFACEAQGLRHLASTDTVLVPEVLGHGPDFLALEDLGQEHKERSATSTGIISVRSLAAFIRCMPRPSVTNATTSSASRKKGVTH